MDEIEQRLKDTTAHCIQCYEAWQPNQKNEEARENLAEAIHELRKVASRLEIEIAVSEREQMAGRPIAIPPHRSQRKAHGGDDIGYDGGDDDDIGNTMPDDNSGNPINAGQPRRQNNNMRRPGGGGNGGGGQNRGRRPGGGGGQRPNNQQGNGGNE